MQTFLPYGNYRRSAKVLDRPRLGKQRIENMTILKTNLLLKLNPMGSFPWYNHPATVMWYGYEISLYKYQLAICEEWLSRGYKDTCLGKTVDLLRQYADAQGPALSNDRPPWLGNEQFHLSHRSNLLRKNPEHYGPIFGDIPDGLPYYWPSNEGN